MIITLPLGLAALFLACSNGANDNFKGFATCWGSATLSWRTALLIACAATVAGGIASIVLADGLVKAFSGRGLVPDALVATQVFALAVAAGAGLTVALATRLGFPVSTTHAIIGGLTGAGLASEHAVNFAKLGSAFLLPLLLSPVVAAVFSYGFCRLLCRGPSRACDAPASRAGDLSHIASAATICFARAVNDTPKLAALLLATRLVPASTGALAITAAMAIAGLVFARRVAETMSLGITRISPSQGICANMLTAAIVLTASAFTLPVSTTHVSVGSIAGSGWAARSLKMPTVKAIVLSWLITLPLAGILAAIVYRLGA